MMKLQISVWVLAPSAKHSTSSSNMKSLARHLALLAIGLVAGTSVFAQALASASPASMVPAQLSEQRAQEDAASPPDSGAATRSWLKAQARREQASNQRQVLSGPIMSRVNKRHTDSFPVTSEPTKFHNNSDR
jgi:hypothetical protein